jgi:tetratricopeptide (TPR) repeat protein
MELEPIFPDAYICRCNIYSLESKIAESIVHYTKVIEIKPLYTEYYMNIVLAYSKTVKLDEAHFTKLIDLDAQNLQAYIQRATIYVTLNKYTEAITDYSSFIDINSNDQLIYYSRGRLYTEIQQISKAIADYSKAIEIHPLYINAYYNRANVYQQIGKFEEAICDYS